MSPLSSTDRASDRPQGWRIWWSTARPATLWAGAVPVVVASAVAFSEGVFRWPPALAALLGAIFIQIGTNFANDLADFKKGADTDARLGPPRATQRGWLTAREVAGGAAVAFAVAVGIGVYLTVVAGWPIVVLGVASIAAGVAYTSGPLPLGYVGLGDLFVLLFFGYGAVCGTYFVQADTISVAATWVAFPIGALATAILVVNNLRDRDTDRVAGKRTLAVRFGARFARAEYAALVGGAYLSVISAWLLDVGHRGWLLPWLSLPLAVREIRAVLSQDGAALNPHLGGTARLELLFGMLLAGGVLWR